MSTFDQVAASWDQNPKRLEMIKKITSFYNNSGFHSNLGHVLDFGCGTGLLGLQLLPHASKVTFADNSIEMLKQVRDKIGEFNITNAITWCIDLSRGKIPEDEFDTIVTSMALHHVKDIPELISNFQRMLRPEGQLMIIDLIKEDGSFHTDDFDVAHHGFLKEEMEEYLSNFVIQDFSIVHTMIKPNKYNQETEYPIFMLQAKKHR